MKMLARAAGALWRWYTRKLCAKEYLNQDLTEVNERAVEYRFVFEQLARRKVISVLDVGTGTTALPALMRTCGFLVTATDNVYDYWPGGMFNRHFHVIDDDIRDTGLEGGFDAITCVSVLEHIGDHEAAVRSMFGLLNEGGDIVLTFPYTEDRYVENIFALPGCTRGRSKPYMCSVYSREVLDAWVNQNRGDIVAQEYWRFFSGDIWRSGEPVYPPKQVWKDSPHQLTCIVIRKRDHERDQGAGRRG